MALTYEESAALMVDKTFIERVKVACLKYAAYIMDEAPSVPGHSGRMRWAQPCLVAPDNATAQIVPSVVMDGQVQVDGAGISDAALQTSVESCLNKLM